MEAANRKQLVETPRLHLRRSEPVFVLVDRVYSVKGAMIRERREELGLNQAGIAAKMGFTRMRISQFETAESTDMKEGLALLLADALKWDRSVFSDFKP